MVPLTSLRPRYLSFLLTGGVMGLVATFVVVLGPGADVDDRRRLLLYLGVLFVGLGALLGGGLAVLLEARGNPADDDKSAPDQDVAAGDDTEDT